MKIALVHPETRQVKLAKIGFSWTVLCFNFFPPLFRGDWKWAAIMFGCAIITCNFSALVFMFIYNKLYIMELLRKGYQADNEISRQLLLTYGFIIDDYDTYDHIVDDEDIDPFDF
ncbi:MAG: hypothetical protein ACTH54_00025 [Vagococcus salmoninarum]|uniref:hypothetical protein n=1 Tax=Vagococcus salmoninarum TaxID=2739 RepID=UPI003F9CF0DB